MSAPASIPSASKSARGNSNGVDRLSSLCDELLHHVMSFLPMPEVVRTSLLSPRWRNLWASTPFVHIDYQDFRNKYMWRVDDDKMEKFGNRLLLLRDSTFSLVEARILAHNVDCTITYSVWIRHAIKHNVRLLHVAGYQRCLILDDRAMFHSQHLKIIRLQSLILRPSFFRSLNSDCHVVEHLEIESCILGSSVENLEISSRSLKSLQISMCIIEKDILINARNLTHLSILDPERSSAAIVTRDLSSLVTASISIDSCNFDYEGTILEHCILDGLSRATTLELNAPLLELAFWSGFDVCPVFSNLTSLMLGGRCVARDSYLLLCIIQHAPKLKELLLMLKMTDWEVYVETAGPASLPSRRAPSGTFPRVGRIKISCRGDDPRVGALVQALLPIVTPDGKITVEGY